MSELDQIHGDMNEPGEASLVANVDPDNISSNEQKTIPYVAGKASVPCMWIGVIYDQYQVDAPVERPGKK